MSKSNINLPRAPKELCFSETDFIQENFNVDTFLQEHRKNTKLETMRDDLGVYLKLLRSAMIDLINRDYTDFVNLSSNLIGLDKAINDLQTPLGQLKEEVMQVRQTLDDEIMTITHNISENERIRDNKQSVYSLQHVYTSLNKLSSIISLKAFLESPNKIDILEQAAGEFNQLQFHVSRCKLNIINEKQKDAERLEQSYMTYLNEFFLACIQEKNSVLLIRCLKIYITLDKIRDAENLVRKEIVDPLIRSVINIENLQMDLLGLQNMYNKLLNILSVELKQLLDITLYPNRLSVKGYNFLVNSFWIDVEEKIEEYIKCIFAPGDPVLFHMVNKKKAKFWKFTLQICARYQIWIQTVLKEVWPVENEVGNTSTIEHSTKLNFLICLYKDVEKFVNILPSLLQTVKSKLKQESPTVLKMLKDSLDETIKNFNTILPEITEEIVNELLKQCVTHLKQVSDIPRLFRRTKRDVPTKPCAYVKNTLAFLINFRTDYKQVIPDNINYLLELALSSLTEHYLASVTDVLTSVQKTEESLRRLKKIRDKSTGSHLSEVQGISDDEKIRIQLQVDVQAYAKMITEMEIPTSNVLHVKELLYAVETATRK
ncbi:conserved oligomeric Golgi complex subunit 2 isoform X1 [Xylocopa sonorina]|uniref:conserved oligomeric Golgi complex subunit 2 isoform X1 n=1 Tax=Xylocopa sonorina TaxID=1818115 RepID=UPI00403B3671